MGFYKKFTLYYFAGLERQQDKDTIFHFSFRTSLIVREVEQTAKELFPYPVDIPVDTHADRVKEFYTESLYSILIS